MLQPSQLVADKQHSECDITCIRPSQIADSDVWQSTVPQMRASLSSTAGPAAVLKLTCGRTCSSNCRS